MKITDRNILKIRSNARRTILNIIDAGFKAGYTTEIVYNHIDEYIDFAEIIGLFETNELRQQIIEILSMRISK